VRKVEKNRRFPTALLICLAAWPLSLRAQIQSAGNSASSPSARIASEEHYPDQGYLSPTRYTNAYFGFTFDLPPDTQLKPTTQPVATDGHAQLLDVAGPPPQHAEISISAYPARAKSNFDAKHLLRRQLDQELFIGVEELRGLSKVTLDKHQFLLYETRRGIDEHVMLAADMESYVLTIVLASHDERIVKELLNAFLAAKFFDPAQALQIAGADAKPYEGPAMSAHRLAMLKADPPANHIDAGRISGTLYQNVQLGISYSLPMGWTIGSAGVVEALADHAHPQSDIDLLGADEPWIGRGERELLKVCNRVLFSAASQKAGADGQVSYNDFGEVTLSAMSLECLPDLKFPNIAEDPIAVKDFLRQFSLTHPLVREMRTARAFEASGHVFVLTQGVVALQAQGDSLSSRISVAIGSTLHRGYLLTWFFAAPHDTELRELMAAKMGLEPETPVNRPKNVHEISAGGGTSALAGAPSPPSVPRPSPSSNQTDSAASKAAETGSADPSDQKPAASAPGQSDGPNASESGRPSLLRPGETMSEQQISGRPIPKK
jgi:hypothetical protein